MDFVGFGVAWSETATMRGREKWSIKDEGAVFPYLKAYVLRTHNDANSSVPSVGGVCSLGCCLALGKRSSGTASTSHSK